MHDLNNGMVLCKLTTRLCCRLLPKPKAPQTTMALDGNLW